MTRRPSFIRPVSIWIENVLALFVASGVGYVAFFLYREGYLPQPFFFDVSDSLMDLYATAYWSHQKGVYSAWNSVYPPVSFVFLRLFSISQCYAIDAYHGRDCDTLIRYCIYGFFALNAVLVYFVYRKDCPREAAPRAFALACGLPMLFGLDRGNLVIPCFTCFCLAFGGLWRSENARIGMLTMAINFKPYLLTAAFPALAHRRLQWLVKLGASTATLYFLTYALQGGGSPMEIIENAKTFTIETGDNFWEKIYYSTSFAPLLRFGASDFPLLQYIDSTALDRLILLFSSLMRLGLLGAAAVFVLVAVSGVRIDERRFAAMTITLLLVMSESSGGYASIFALYLVFFERWTGWVRPIMLVCAYLLCVPLDIPVMPVFQGANEAFWGGREVYGVFGVSVGQFARPLLLVAILYCLIGLNAVEAIRSIRANASAKAIAT